jgi:ABC-type polysaccharide/polyol phosphate transport system ATPase subunit
MKPPFALRFQNVSKLFTVAGEAPQTVLETIVSAVRRNAPKPRQLWAAKDLDFEIPHGQTVGFIGINGSGKSTILKLATQILYPTSGEVTVHGRVSALLELGAGFHPDLTGMENIYLNGSLLGLSRADIDGRLDEIIAFSELGDYIYMPVKHYSSGMYTRLAFSVAIHVSPDILFIDEILAVGDHAFQNKCFDRIHTMQRSKMTIVIVSHDLRSLQNLCDRLIWVNEGQKMADGSPQEVLRQYLEFMRALEQARITKEFANDGAMRRWGSREVEITAVRILDGNGQDTQQFSSDDPMIVEIEYHAEQPIENPQFSLAMFRVDGVQVNAPNTQLARVATGTAHGRGTIRYKIERISLLPSVYELTTAVFDRQGLQTYDFHDRAYTFRVVYTTHPETHGLLSLPAQWVVGEGTQEERLEKTEDDHE